jgi:hypothetical protein
MQYKPWSIKELTLLDELEPVHHQRAAEPLVG